MGTTFTTAGCPQTSLAQPDRVVDSVERAKGSVSTLCRWRRWVTAVHFVFVAQPWQLGKPIPTSERTEPQEIQWERPPNKHVLPADP